MSAKLSAKQVIAVIVVVIGAVSVILGISAFGRDSGYGERNYAYGGDAYTGIQNASAQTANNLVTLTKSVNFATGAILLIGGLALMAAGLMCVVDVPAQDEEESCSGPVPAQATPVRHTPAVETWTCSCGKVNAAYMQSCSCGMTKQGARQQEETQPLKTAAHNPGMWQCTCGKVNPPYVSTCDCGVNKRDVR